MADIDIEASSDSEIEPYEFEGVQKATINATHDFDFKGLRSSGLFPSKIKYFLLHEMLG